MTENSISQHASSLAPGTGILNGSLGSDRALRQGVRVRLASQCRNWPHLREYKVVDVHIAEKVLQQESVHFADVVVQLRGL